MHAYRVKGVGHLSLVESLSRGPSDAVPTAVALDVDVREHVPPEHVCVARDSVPEHHVLVGGVLPKMVRDQLDRAAEKLRKTLVEHAHVSLPPVVAGEVKTIVALRC